MSEPERPEDVLLNVSPNGKPGRFVVTASFGPATPWRDAFDLNSAYSRKKFVTAAVKTIAPDLVGELAEEFRASLENRLLAYAAVPPGPVELPPTEKAPEDPRVSELAQVPEDIRSEAVALLTNPRLIERISADIRTVGVVGEELIALTLYLTGTSVQLREPLAVVVRGPSSSGKSFVVEAVTSLFPAEVTLRATDLSPNALYYFKPGELRHRWVVAGERSRIEDDERAEATRALREMISSGHLRKAVPMKDGDRIVTQVLTQDGPIAFVETTTLENIFAEDANRCLVFSTDERDEQTRRILDATAARAAGMSSPDLERVRAVHHAIQRMLPRVDVIVPFAPDISALLPANRVEERRDLPKVLRLVQASALLRHRQRDRDAVGRVVATAADYQLALKLASHALGAARSGLSDPARRCLTLLLEKFGTNPFDSNVAEKAVMKSRSSVRGWLGAIAKAGLIKQTEQNKGPNPAVWQLTGEEPAATAGYLPAVALVMEHFSKRTPGRLDA